jgi:acyl-CoA thioesterase I
MVRAHQLAALVCAVATPGLAVAAPTKIACVGASTTSGDGSTPGHHYPDELQRLEGAAAAVQNFGVSGTTMLRATTTSYWNTPQFTQALAYQPDVVVIWFGGNDAKPENWTTHSGEFLGDYEAMIHMFQALPSHPRTYVVLSLLTHDTEGIPKMVVDDQVVPLCRQAAAETGSGIVDVHDDLADHPEYFPDGIHPDDMGTIAVAQLVHAEINAPPDGGAPDGSGGDASEPEGSTMDGGVESEPVVASPDADAAAAPEAAQPWDAGASPQTGGPTDGALGGAGSFPKTSERGSSSGCDVLGNRPTSYLSLALFAVPIAIALRRSRGVNGRRHRQTRRSC